MWLEKIGLRTPLASPVFDDEMKKAAVDALCGERFVLGESFFRFEEEFVTTAPVSLRFTYGADKVFMLML